MLQGLIDQKKEYIEHLQNLLAIPIAERIYSIYIDCQKKGLRQFQYELNQISKWNNYNIEQETKQIVAKTKCKYILKLLKITILTCIKIKFYEYKNKLKDLDLKLPSLEDFVHKCFINAAEFSWKNPYLFVQSNLKAAEIQNNLNIIEFNIRKMVAKTITECIHVEEIIEFLDDVMERKKEAAKKKELVKREVLLRKQEVAAAKEKAVSNEDESADDVENSEGGSESQDESEVESEDHSEDESACDDDIESVNQSASVAQNGSEGKSAHAGEKGNESQSGNDSSDSDDSDELNTNQNNLQRDDVKNEIVTKENSDDEYDVSNMVNNTTESEDDINDGSSSDESISESDDEIIDDNRSFASASNEDSQLDEVKITQNKEDIKVVNIVDVASKPVRKHKKSSFF
jgi:hypothetical protein